MQISSDHIYPLHSAPAPLSPPGQVTALRPHNDNIVREEARAPSQQRDPSRDKEMFPTHEMVELRLFGSNTSLPIPVCICTFPCVAQYSDVELISMVELECRQYFSFDISVINLCQFNTSTLSREVL